MRLQIAVVLSVLVSLVFLLIGCGGPKTSAPKPANGNDPLPNAYILTPDERPDFEKMVLLQTAPFLNDNALWSSADGFVKRLAVQLGTKQIYAQEAGGKGVAVKF